MELMHGLDADLDNLQQYVGWHAQEKYRGVRLFWDGYRAWTRQGKPVALPEHWTLPAGTALDCELYDGIDGERRCATAVRWGRFTDSMRVVAFDLPHDGGVWSERLEDLASIAGAAYGRYIESMDHMLRWLAFVHASGGEGLMLRDPEGRYTAGRSNQLIKLKHAK